MQRFKGTLELFFIIALALLLLLGLFVAGLMKRASLVSYEERINLALVLDNAGGGALSLLNSGEAGAKNMELLAYPGDSSVLEQALQDLGAGIAQEVSLKVLVSGEQALSLGPDAPEEAASVKAEMPLPCREGGACRGELEVATW